MHLNPDHLVVKFSDYSYREVEVRWDGWNTATIRASVAVNTCGLCGNNNGNQGDEFYNTWFRGTTPLGM